MRKPATKPKTRRGKKTYRRYTKSRMPKMTYGYMNCFRRYNEIAVRNTVLAGNISINPSNNIFFAFNPAIANQVGAYDVPFSMVFTLNQLIDSTDFTVLFDSYKINKITVKMYYSSNKTDWSGGASTTTAPTIEYITDHDDAEVPTVAQVRQKMGIKQKSFRNNNFINITIYPRVASSVYNGGLTTAYSTPNKAVWLDMSNANVPHYGIKGIISNIPLPAQETIGLTNAIKIEATAYISLKGLQ